MAPQTQTAARFQGARRPLEAMLPPTSLACLPRPGKRRLGAHCALVPWPSIKARLPSLPQVVVDQIPPNVLVSNCVTKTFDFQTCSEQDLQRIVIPLSLQVAVPCTGEAGKSAGTPALLSTLPCLVEASVPSKSMWQCARTAPSLRLNPCRTPALGATFSLLCLPSLLRIDKTLSCSCIPAPQCTAWPRGLMCCLTAPRRSAGCPRRQACPSRTGGPLRRAVAAL